MTSPTRTTRYRIVRDCVDTIVIELDNDGLTASVPGDSVVLARYQNDEARNEGVLSVENGMGRRVFVRDTVDVDRVAVWLLDAFPGAAVLESRGAAYIPVVRPEPVVFRITEEDIANRQAKREAMLDAYRLGGVEITEDLELYIMFLTHEVGHNPIPWGAA